MGLYKQCPQLIEAHQFTPTNVMAILDWMDEKEGQGWLVRTRPPEGRGALALVVLTETRKENDGKVLARVGDYIAYDGHSFNVIPKQDFEMSWELAVS